MKHRLPLLLLAAATLLATACHSLRKPATQQPEPQPVEAPAAPRYSLVAFAGTVEGLSVSGQVRMAQDSVIWCSVSKLFEVGRAMATPDSLWVRAPLVGINERGTYAALKRRFGVATSFDDLQEILLSDDAEQRIAALAKKLGYKASVRITRREQVDRLTFPFQK